MTTLTALWFDKGKSNETWFLAFEAYGHAMAAAAALELQMVLFVIKQRVSEVDHNNHHRISEHDLAKFGKATRKKTFPKLISALRRTFAISDGLLEALEIAKTERDALAHVFWHTNIGFLQTKEGVEIIVQQCSIAAWHFKEVSAELERELGFSVDDFADQSAKSAAFAHAEFAAFLAKLL